jgi:hypothetical protein
LATLRFEVVPPVETPTTWLVVSKAVEVAPVTPVFAAAKKAAGCDRRTCGAAAETAFSVT